MRRSAALIAGLAALGLPASAWAHAALVRTVPQASRVLERQPREVRLTYTEPVEPRFAIVSVTNAAGRQVTAGDARAAQGNRNQLVVPLQEVPSGWYLVFWRVISLDGHPVRGGFTFAVGPSPGPPPQFAVPSLSETATTPRLLITRWIVFLSLMSALGLFALRMFVGRPLVRVLPGSSLRALSIAFWSALAIALVATPFYVLFSTAQFELRSALDLGAIVPLARESLFARGYLDLELLLALFGGAAGVALWIDRPDRGRRSVAEILALTGAVVAGLATLVVPGLVGHPSQVASSDVALFLDAAHLLAGSIWIGGLIGLVVLWQTAGALRRVGTLSYVVPRFSRVALVSVLLLLGSGIWASVLHVPTLASLWQTSFGKVILVKVALLGTAIVLAAVNFLRTRPRLAAAQRRPDLAGGASNLLRQLVSAEIVLVVWAIFAAAVLTSFAPPSKALAQVRGASARVGPGPVSQVVEKAGYRLAFRVNPNRAAVPNDFSVDITRGGKPVRGAEVVARFAMLDMEMGELSYRLPERAPGVFARTEPALVMVGHWGLEFEITPPGRQPFTVLLVDRASG